MAGIDISCLLEAELPGLLSVAPGDRLEEVAYVVAEVDAAQDPADEDVGYAVEDRHAFRAVVPRPLGELVDLVPRLASEELGRVPDRHRQAYERRVPAEVVADEQQRVAQLQVLHRRGSSAHVRVADDGVPDDAYFPARPPGPLGEVGFLAVGEVALVEQPDIEQAPPVRDY